MTRTATTTSMTLDGPNASSTVIDDSQAQRIAKQRSTTTTQTATIASSLAARRPSAPTDATRRSLGWGVPPSPRPKISTSGRRARQHRNWRRDPSFRHRDVPGAVASIHVDWRNCLFVGLGRPAPLSAYARHRRSSSTASLSCASTRSASSRLNAHCSVSSIAMLRRRFSTASGDGSSATR